MDNRHTKNLDKEQENRHHHHSVLWVSLWKETKAKEKGGRHRYRGRQGGKDRQAGGFF